MKSSLFIANLSTHLKSILKHLEDFHTDANPEHLHQLRVCIKKIRAILTFVPSIPLKKDDLQNLKHLFKKAGEILELQIHLETLTRLKVPSASFVEHHKQRLIHLTCEFKEHIPIYTGKLHQLETLIHMEDFPIKSKLIQNLFASKRKAAVKAFHQKKRKEMHEFRKSIKELDYLYEMLPEKQQKEIRLDKNLIRQLQKKVGEWHDTFATLTFLKNNKSVYPEITSYLQWMNQKEKKQWKLLLNHYPSLTI